MIVAAITADGKVAHSAGTFDSEAAARSDVARVKKRRWQGRSSPGWRCARVSCYGHAEIAARAELHEREVSKIEEAFDLARERIPERR